MKIVIIGSGNLATQLALALKDANQEIVQVFSRTSAHAKELADKIGCAYTASLEAGEKVQLVGFGVFDVKRREKRIGRNPRTKETIEVPPTRVPVFKAGKSLREAVMLKEE